MRQASSCFTELLGFDPSIDNARFQARTSAPSAHEPVMRYVLYMFMRDTKMHPGLWIAPRSEWGVGRILVQYFTSSPAIVRGCIAAALAGIIFAFWPNPLELDYDYGSFAVE